MISISAFPHLTADPAAIQGTPWTAASENPWSLLDFLKDWDPSLDIYIRRSLVIDGIRLCESTGIGSDAKICALASWRGSGTMLRGAGRPIIIDLKNRHGRVDLELSIPGQEVSTSLHLRTSVVLLQPGTKNNVLAARHPGSILWIDPAEEPPVIFLQGDASRFPVTALDFVKSGIGEKGTCWLLDWNPEDVDAQVMLSLRLYINTSNEIFHKAITSANPTGEELMMRSTLRYDIARALVTGAILSKKEILSRDHEEGTVGRVLLDIINIYLSPYDLGSLAEIYERAPAQLEALLQSRFGLFLRGEAV